QRIRNRTIFQKEEISSTSKSSTKLGFYVVDNIISYLEGLSQHLIWNWRCSKQSWGLQNNPRQVTVEGSEGKGLSYSNIQLEVNQSPGNDEHLPSSQNLGMENIVSCNKPHKELPLYDHAGLGRARMRVGRIQTARGKVDSVHRNPKSVEARK
ncbi:LOW QUALITY PROTEIN: hypothetical protein PanWU01x14_346660, partial [Parasponia andersonii]